MAYLYYNYIILKSIKIKKKIKKVLKIQMTGKEWKLLKVLLVVTRLRLLCLKLLLKIV